MTRILISIVLLIVLEVVHSKHKLHNVGHIRTSYGRMAAPRHSKLAHPIFAWKQIDYQDERSHPRISFSNSSVTTELANLLHDDYIKYNNVPMGVTRWKNKVIIATPRRRKGIPLTLSYVDYDEKDDLKTKREMALKPYPDLKVNILNQGNNITGFQLVSVYRTRIDECNRLWMVDTGLLEYPDNPIQVQPAAIVVLDLPTGKLLHRYELPADQVRSNSMLASVTVDVLNPSNCDDTFAYVPDVYSYAIIVYDMKSHRSWRIANDAFRNERDKGDFIINNNLEFHWDDGIFCLTLGPRDDTGYRIGFFHSMAGTHEFSVNTRFLREPSDAKRDQSDIVHLGDKGSRQQTSTSTYHPNSGVMFYNLVNDNGLSCWNTKKPFTRENYVLLFQDNDKFIYPSDTSVDEDGSLWVMTNTMPYFLYSNLNVEYENYKIWKFNVDELIKNSKCAN